MSNCNIIGETTNTNRNSTTLSRTFVPLRYIPMSDLGHSVLVNSNKDISLKPVQKDGILSPKMVLTAKVGVF